MSRFSARLAAGLKAVFGNVQWTPPVWLAGLWRATHEAAHGISAAVKTNPKRSLALGASLIVVLIAAVLTWRWYESRPKPVEYALTVMTPKITCYTREPPVTPNPLVVTFSGSTAPLDRAGHDVDVKKAGIDISPAVAGQWTWTDDRSLRFQPAADWPIDTTYTVKLDRHHFAASNVHLQEYKFEFSTAKFDARVANTEFYQDPVVARNKKVVVTINFSHPVDVDTLERHVELAMFDRVNDKLENRLAAPKHVIVFDKLKLNAFIHSAELEIPPKAGRLEVTVKPGLRAARGGNETSQTLTSNVAIPGLNSLTVQNVSLDIARDERNEPNQVLLVNLSATVNEKDMPGKLQAWLLPAKHPDAKLQAQFERYGKGPYRWSATSVNPEVLQASTPLELKQIPGEREHYELHSFRYTADPGRQIYVTVQRGLKSFGGYVLGDTIERILQVPEFPRELSILHQGSLLAMSGQKTLTLLARNIPAIQVETNRLLPKQLQHLVTQTSGSLSQPTFRDWAFDAANLTERFTKIIKLPPAAPGVAQYEALDLNEYLSKDADDRRGVFLLRVQAWNPVTNKPLAGYEAPQWNQANSAQIADARMIVVTDLGLVVKRAIDGSQEVFVQSLHDGKPVAGANVAVIGVNGLPVISQTSDAEGHVHFGDLKQYKREQKPALYYAKLGGDSSFLPIDERARSLDFSRFDVGGVQSSADRGALTAYLFSDRGIYRPGEQIRLGAILRSLDWQRSMTGVPLRLEVTDPRGVTIRRETFTPGVAGFNEVLHDTKVSSATGTYTFSLSIVRNENYGDLIGSTTVQVREFLPDRLRLQTTFSKTSVDGWVAPEDLQASLHLENLFGTPAEKRRVTAQLALSPRLPTFRAFADYQFYDPQLAKDSFNERLPDAITDENGHAAFDLKLQRFARATYSVHVIAEGFEPDGGRGVTAESTQLVSNMPFLVGYKPDGDLSYLKRDSAHTVQVISIDNQAKRLATDKLTLTRLEVRYVSVLMRQANGTYKYESRRKETEIATTPLAIPAAGHSLSLDTSAPGSFAYVVRDADGLQFARVDYQVAGDANLARKLDKNAELELALPKHDYAPGEDLEVSIRAPYAGAGLITIERERTYAWRWFKTTTTSSVQHIKIPEGVEGNAYVTVTFVRDPGSDEIYTSPLSYGAQPFSINLDARRNPLTIETPALVKPGESFKLRYSTKQPSRIVLFAVDEGILQVARYQAPDPLGHFFQKRALEVQTSQILDLLLPEFRQLGLAAAPGGDAEALLRQHLNPFRRKGDKPVAYWSGLLEADATPREATFVVPDYFNGTLRVMAVAVSEQRVGIYDGKSLVRGDFVLSPNTPTTVAPGDEFDVSVGVANSVEGSGAEAQVEVALEVDRGLQIVGDPHHVVKIAEGHEDSTRFRVKARDELGAQNLKFTAKTASGKTGSAARRIDLSVRPATPYMTQLRAGSFRTGNIDVPLERTLYPQFRTLEAGVSSVPLSFAHGFVSYLGHYPYACTEQIVSQAMPAIVLGKRSEFGYVRTEPGADLTGLLSELRSRQNDVGAYKLWPGSEQVVEFVSLYAQHALIEAGERGQRVGTDIILQGNNYLRKVAARDGNNLGEERNSAYAIYLLTRQGQNLSAEITSLRKRLQERYKKEWPTDLTAMWLAATLDMMKQDDEAGRLIRGVTFTDQKTSPIALDVYFDPMTRDAFLLYVLSRHFPERLPDVPAEVFTTLAKRVNDNLYHSLSAGTTLLALDAYTSAAQDAQATFGIAQVLKPDKRVQPLTLPASIMPKVAFTELASSLRFSNESPLNGFYLVEQSGFDRSVPTTALKSGMEVLREYSDAQGKALSDVKMGDEITVHLKFRGIDSRFGGVALVDLLPGGFELVVPPPGSSTPHMAASPAQANGEADEGDEEAAGNDSRFIDRSWQCGFCTGGNVHTLEYADIREDRVVFYAWLTNDVQEIVYRIKATTSGEFAVPPAYGEALYDRSIVGRSSAAKMKVIRP